ncbi:MAG: ATP-dependent RecD-like DNA helicase [Erysipelotrichia bacterium]|nr:ATP-dependent RecD-like DNA helicase [Erysipelotrichia bacterium]NCC54985.1 ATP-dependent RecD-like DNA helicase [Erysipelotrichia bacterium]
MDDICNIEGMFKIIIFQSENGYTVAKFVLNQKDEKMLTVTGYLHDILEDTPYRLKGVYKEHHKYGMQFDIVSYERIMPTDQDSLIRYFSSPIFHGIGKKCAAKIVTQLGKDCISLLKKDNDIIFQVHGLSKKQRESIIEGIQSDVSIDDSVVFLTQHGMTLKNIMKVEAVYEDRAIAMIKENPYQMIVDIDGIGFKTADKIAKTLGFEDDHPYRMKAAIISVVNDITMSSGNTYTNRVEILKHLFKNFSYVDEDLFDNWIHELVMERLLYVEEDAYYPIAQYDAEKGIAVFLSGFPYVEVNEVSSDILENKINTLQLRYHIEYEQKQIEAIKSFFAQPFSIITGGPGTGKTTIVRAIIDVYKDLFPLHKMAVCAPTGRAAKRLKELSQVETCTIHSLLKWDLETNTFAVNEEDPIDANLLIVDEFSMVDAWLFYNLLKASKYVGRILLIGDEDQLPSVGPGFVLKDLIQSNHFHVARLNKIFRQKEGSDVVKLANEIKQGHCDTLLNGKEAKLFTCQNYQVKEQIIKIVANAFEKGYTINEIQVLAPMYNGVAGIDALNKALQELCNPSDPFKQELSVGYRLFREQDKVLQLKNLPDENVYNGDIGTIIEIIDENDDYAKQKRMIVDFDGNIVEYTNENFNMITHAYCISIHKSQGSEYPIVIMPILKDYYYMLQRRLIYTGITRAKKSLVLLGSKEVLEEGINKEERHPRKTKLTQRILKYCE